MRVRDAAPSSAAIRARASGRITPSWVNWSSHVARCLGRGELAAVGEQLRRHAHAPGSRGGLGGRRDRGAARGVGLPGGVERPGKDPVQDPTPTRPTDLTRPPQRDLPAGHKTHLTPLIHACVSDRKPEPGAQPRAYAHIDRRALDDRPTANPAATRTATHPTSAVHIPAALDQENAQTAGSHPRVDRHARSARRDNLHPLPDDQEPGQ